MTMNRVIVASFLAVIAMQVYKDYENPTGTLKPLPLPSHLVWTAVVFGILSVVADMFNPKIGEIIAGGVVMGMFYNTVTAPKPTKKSGQPAGNAPRPVGSPVKGSTASGG